MGQPRLPKFTSNYVDILDDPAANAEWCEFIADKIRGLVDDPATAEKLIPQDHRYGQKRPPYVTGYFEAFNRPNVALVDLRETPIVRVTETGIETTDGLREHDVIVWATGFDFGTGAMLRMGIRGRDGSRSTDHWADGPTTFLGVQTARLPEPVLPRRPPRRGRQQPPLQRRPGRLRHRDARPRSRDAGRDVIEVTAEAEERWTAMIDQAASHDPVRRPSASTSAATSPASPSATSSTPAAAPSSTRRSPRCGTQTGPRSAVATFWRHPLRLIMSCPSNTDY